MIYFLPLGYCLGDSDSVRSVFVEFVLNSRDLFSGSGYLAGQTTHRSVNLLSSLAAFKPHSTAAQGVSLEDLYSGVSDSINLERR